MADVSGDRVADSSGDRPVGTSGDREDRGQLLIVAAVGLAILLAVLALSLNTAVYADVHVAGSDDSLTEERAALGYQHSAERAVSGLLPVRGSANASYADLETDLREDVDRWATMAATGYADDATMTNTSVTAVTFDHRIVQENQSTFTDQAGNRSWTVAANATDVEEFRMNISGESLAELDDCVPESDCFTLTAEGSGNGSWTLSAYRNQNDSTVTLTVDPASGDPTSCETTDTPAPVNVTEGEFDHPECPDTFTSFLADDGLEPPYTLTYTNADAVNGTYHLNASGEILDGSIEDDGRFGHEPGEEPRVDVRIDTAALEVEYRSPALSYRTELQVGEGTTDG